MLNFFFCWESGTGSVFALKHIIWKRVINIVKNFIYCSGTYLDYKLDKLKRYFLKAEKEMIDYFKLEKNYDVSFNGWIMTIKNDELEEKINLQYFCQCEFVIYDDATQSVGIEYLYDNHKEALWFNKTPTFSEFFGIDDGSDEEVKLEFICRRIFAWFFFVFLLRILIFISAYDISGFPIYMQVGQRLKELRKQKGVSQQVIADYLGVNRSTYTNYEMGTSTMTYITILMLAKYYSVDFNTSLCYDTQNKIKN